MNWVGLGWTEVDLGELGLSCVDWDGLGWTGVDWGVLG